MLSENVRKNLEFDISAVCCDEARRKIIDMFRKNLKDDVWIQLVTITPHEEDVPELIKNELVKEAIEAFLEEVSELECEELYYYLQDIGQTDIMEHNGKKFNLSNSLSMDMVDIIDVLNSWYECGQQKMRWEETLLRD